MFNKVLTPNIVMDQLCETSPGISTNNNACNLSAMFAMISSKNMVLLNDHYFQHVGRKTLIPRYLNLEKHR